MSRFPIILISVTLFTFRRRRFHVLLTKAENGDGETTKARQIQKLQKTSISSFSNNFRFYSL